MKVDRVRIRHFRCIVDTGEMFLDDRLTVLLGANECGKTAILEALSYFNRGRNFEEVDLSTVSGFAERVRTGQVNRRNVDIVTVWVSLSEEDLIALGIPTPQPGAQVFKIAKSLDNEYKVERITPILVVTSTKQEKLLQLLQELKNKIENVYRGRIKTKYAHYFYSFVERFEGETLGDNLILFPEYAAGVWDDLKTGDWIQVTRSEPDPYRRNTKALNAGVEIDTQPIIANLSKLIEATSAGMINLDALRELQLAVNEIPQFHPLREFLSSETMLELIRLSREDDKQEKELPLLPQQIDGILPDFVYLDSIQDVSYSISTRSLLQGTPDEPEALLASLVKAVGLQPQAVVQTNEIVQQRILDDKSTVLTNRLREHWVGQDLSVDLARSGQKLTIWIRAAGSGDPPSRRSRGLNWYLSIFAKLAELSTRRNVVVLLDDPGTNLHPIAQRKMLPLLDSQPFQIVMTTHVPFMIDPDHLERIRIVVRSSEGTRLEEDWNKAADNLLPVWGSLFGATRSDTWLIVEGVSDRRAYSHMSGVCARTGKQSLPGGIMIVPGGGNQLRFLVQELVARGIKVAILLDGDKEGRLIKKHVTVIPGFDPRRVSTLDEVGLGIKNPRLQDLFSDSTELAVALNPEQQSNPVFNAQTIDRFGLVFEHMNQRMS